MDNDNKIEENNKIHQEVMLFLGDELSTIHKNTAGQAYNIEKEYEKTKKNKSKFVIIILVSCFIAVFGIAFMMNRIISAKNEEITVSLQEFDGLNLKNLLDTVSSAQTNYDNAVKNKIQVETDLESQLKAAEEARDNDIFVVDSMNLKYKTVYNDKIALINKQYDAKVKLIHEEYDSLLIQAEKQVEEYKKQMTEFDSAKVESARKQQKALDSERQLRELETKKLTSKYETRIADLEKSITDIQRRNTENMRKAVAEVSAQYQKEIDALDPTIRDDYAIDIIDDAKSVKTPDFNGTQLLIENSVVSDKVMSFVTDYQEIYNNFKYLDDVVASIPQKNSIPHYVSSARILVNDMGEAFIDATVSYYNENTELNNKIKGLNSKIDQMNRDFDKERNDYETKLANQRDYLEESMTALLTVAKSSAMVLEAADYDGIVIFIAPQARYLITEAGADAEIKAGKGIKGKIYRNEDDTFRFEVNPDKEGNLPEINFETITSGTLVKILSK